MKKVRVCSRVLIVVMLSLTLLTTDFMGHSSAEGLPYMGDFEVSSVLYAGKYDFLNITIVNGEQNFVNATVEVSHDVILKWDNFTEGFSVHRDPYNYCTLDINNSFRTYLNDTACKLSWKIKLDWDYPEGPVDIVQANTRVVDSYGQSSSNSVSELFVFQNNLKVNSLYLDTGLSSYSPVVQSPHQRINSSFVVSDLPVPEGYTIVSAQAAAYHNERSEVLHVWYGLKVTGQGEAENEIFYTNTTDFITWTDPVKVISLPEDGIRDPTIFLEDDQIYLFCQGYTLSTGKYHPIHLYKTSISADFWNSSQYLHLGEPVDLGSQGEFDDTWAASFCLTKINETYYGAYEARDSHGTFTIGLTTTRDIESLPYTKQGPLKNSTGDILYNPVEPKNAIVPDTFPTPDILYLHYDHKLGEEEQWQTRYLKGNLFTGRMTLSTGDFTPQDPYQQHNNIAHIGEINGRYTYLMQSWNSASENIRLRLYKDPPAIDPLTPLTIKGTLTYQGTEIPPEDTSDITVIATLNGTIKGSTSHVDSTGRFTITNITTETPPQNYTYTIQPITQKINQQETQRHIQVIPEFPSTIILLLIGITVTLITAVITQKKKHQTKTNNKKITPQHKNQRLYPFSHSLKKVLKSTSKGVSLLNNCMYVNKSNGAF